MDSRRVWLGLGSSFRPELQFSFHPRFADIHPYTTPTRSKAPLWQPGFWECSRNPAIGKKFLQYLAHSCMTETFTSTPATFATCNTSRPPFTSGTARYVRNLPLPQEPAEPKSRKPMCERENAQTVNVSELQSWEGSPPNEPKFCKGKSQSTKVSTLSKQILMMKNQPWYCTLFNWMLALSCVSSGQSSFALRSSDVLWIVMNYY